MKLAKIRSKVLTTALDEKHIKDFGVLSMYLQCFGKEGDCIISDFTREGDKIRLGLKDALSDYFFNERESEKLWELAEFLIGKKLIDMKVIKAVEI